MPACALSAVPVVPVVALLVPVVALVVPVVPVVVAVLPNAPLEEVAPLCSGRAPV